MVTLYRKDDLTGIELEGTGLSLDDMLANGYTESYDEALAAANAMDASSSSPSASTDGTTTTRTQVYTLLPWLQKYGGADANTLVDSYVSGYNNSGGKAEFALAEMRFGKDSKDAYSRVFANIVDPNTGDKAKFSTKNTIIESYKSKNISEGKVLYSNNNRLDVNNILRFY